MKNKNIKYVLVSIAFLLIFTFLFTTKFWLPDDRANMTKQYDWQQLTGAYTVKISNAVLDVNTQMLTTDLYIMSINPEKDPYNFLAFVNGNKNKELVCDVTDTSEPTQKTITVKNIPSDFYYLTIQFRTITEDLEHELLSTSIDYRTIKTIDTKNIVYVLVTPTSTPPIETTPAPKTTAETIPKTTVAPSKLTEAPTPTPENPPL